MLRVGRAGATARTLRALRESRTIALADEARRAAIVCELGVEEEGDLDNVVRAAEENKGPRLLENTWI